MSALRTLFRWLCRPRRDVSDTWLHTQARLESTSGWDGGPRWRSPKEIAQLQRRERILRFKKRA